ncbi:MAG: C-terminal binding protein [Thermomicrobiales bacterium]
MRTEGETRNTSVLVTDYAWPSLDIERGILEPAGIEIVLAERGDEDELALLARGVDAILSCWKPISASVLDSAERCQLISKFGTGVDNIDVERATELGILICNVPDFCIDEVSDHAMALLLAAARRIVPFDAEVRQGVWQPRRGQALQRVRGRTLGVVGYGSIARALIPKARVFGLEVIVFSPRIQSGPIETGVVATNSLHEMLDVADFVSIHAPATAETRRMFDAAAFAAMKEGAWLINTSRGALVDEDALIEALQSGRLGGAALDVLAQEPPDPANPLLQMANVVLTPHAAFASQQAIEDLQRRAAEAVVQVMNGELPQNIVNPEVVASSALRFRRVL